MTSPEFSVLLLAWDDADPAVLVLGGSALPPTLPLVYQLAARQPVLALYPHLPASEATAALEPAAASGTATEADAPAATAAAYLTADPLEATIDGPGVHLLPTPVAPPTDALPTTPTTGSRLVGLNDFLPAIQNALPTSHSLAPATAPGAGSALPTAAPGRSQWPARTGPPSAAAAWQAPAAPYAGAATPANAAPAPSYATARETFPPPPPAPRLAAPPAPAQALAAAEAPAAPAAPATPPPAATFATRAAGAVSVSAAAPAAVVVPAPFDEPVAEVGAAEARDLDAPADDLVPDQAPPAAPAAPPEAAAAAVPPAWAMRQPTFDGLNFRMIQYARQAAQLVDGHPDFDVIYAPGWPGWLAALEIRNRSGRPLVLYAASLASDAAPAAERGWLLAVERMALRRAALVLVPDAGMLRQLRARHGEIPGGVRVVPAADDAAVQRVLAAVARG